MIVSPERVNIHSFTIERPESPSFTFNPQEHLTGEDWQNMRARVQTY